MSKKPKKKYNLTSPRTIESAVDLDQLHEWCRNEFKSIPDDPIRDVADRVLSNLSSFVRWPNRAMLLWRGATRKTKYHKYPKTIRLLALEWRRTRQETIPLDSRVNGPAVAAYRLAGGHRPPRWGSSNGWSIHHIYSGKFHYLGKTETIHAASHDLHCTQSAGLVAIHPIADQMCDEFPAFSWLLRGEAFRRFGYDPDRVFSCEQHDECGFVGEGCFVVPIEVDGGATIQESMETGTSV